MGMQTRYPIVHGRVVGGKYDGQLLDVRVVKEGDRIQGYSAGISDWDADAYHKERKVNNLPGRASFQSGDRNTIDEAVDQVRGVIGKARIVPLEKENSSEEISALHGYTDSNKFLRDVLAGKVKK